MRGSFRGDVSPGGRVGWGHSEGHPLEGLQARAVTVKAPLPSPTPRPTQDRPLAAFSRFFRRLSRDNLPHRPTAASLGKGEPACGRGAEPSSSRPLFVATGWRRCLAIQ